MNYIQLSKIYNQSNENLQMYEKDEKPNNKSINFQRTETRTHDNGSEKKVFDTVENSISEWKANPVIKKRIRID